MKHSLSSPDRNDVSTEGSFATPTAGGVGLAKTYWIYGVFGGIVLNILLKAFSSASFFWALWLFALVYQIAVLIAIWRAANRYRGPRLWRVLSKVAVVLGVIMLGLSVLVLTATHDRVLSSGPTGTSVQKDFPNQDIDTTADYRTNSLPEPILKHSSVKLATANHMLRKPKAHAAKSRASPDQAVQQKCNDDYSYAISSLSKDASLADASDVYSRAEDNLVACLRK